MGLYFFFIWNFHLNYCVLKLYTLGTFYMPSPIFLASEVHSAPHAFPTMPISVGLIALTAHWASSLPSAWLPKTPDEAAQECGRVSSQWSKHRTRGFLRKRQPTRSNPLHSSLQVTGLLTGCFCPRCWPLRSISWCPHPSFHASLPSDPNHTSCWLQFLVKRWCSCLFPTDPRMRQFIFIYENLKQHGAFDVWAIVFPSVDTSFVHRVTDFPYSYSIYIQILGKAENAFIWLIKL